MGMLVEGQWFDDDPPPDRTGRFVRPDSLFRDRVTRDGASGFKAEPGRYQLVTAPSCPWAHRTVLMRKLKRLENALPLLESDLPKGQGWAYSRGFDELQPRDGVFHVHQVYTAARPTTPAASPCRGCGIGRERQSSTTNRLKSSAC